MTPPAMIGQILGEAFWDLLGCISKNGDSCDISETPNIPPEHTPDPPVYEGNSSILGILGYLGYVAGVLLEIFLR